MKIRKKIEVGGPRAICFEFERQKIKFGVQKFVLRTQFSPGLKVIEMFLKDWPGTVAWRTIGKQSLTC